MKQQSVVTGNSAVGLANLDLINFANKMTLTELFPKIKKFSLANKITLWLQVSNRASWQHTIETLFFHSHSRFILNYIIKKNHNSLDRNDWREITEEKRSSPSYSSIISSVVWPSSFFIQEIWIKNTTLMNI